MPSTKRTYDQETVDALAEMFDAAPALPKAQTGFGSAALVQTLKPKILALLEKGYDWNRIAEMMSERGVALRPNVLRKYVAQPANQIKAASRDKAKKRMPPATKRPSKRAPSTSAPELRVVSATEPENAPSPSDALAPDDAWEAPALPPRNALAEPLATIDAVAENAPRPADDTRADVAGDGAQAGVQTPARPHEDRLRALRARLPRTATENV